MREGVNHILADEMLVFLSELNSVKNKYILLYLFIFNSRPNLHIVRDCQSLTWKNTRQTNYTQLFGPFSKQNMYAVRKPQSTDLLLLN